MKEFEQIEAQSLLDHEMAEMSLVEKMSYLKVPSCTSTSLWKALRTLISKMESYKSCWLHHCMPKELLGNQMQWSLTQEVSAQTSHSSEDHRASGKPAALFSPKRNEQKKPNVEFCVRKRQSVRIWVELCSKAINPLLNQARLDLAKRELHVVSLNKCICDLQKRKKKKNRALQDVQKRICWISSRTISIARGIATKGESSSRYIDSKYARNWKDEESACTTSWWDLDSKKLRENQETIQQLTSHLQQWQEQMNSVNSSWEFQDIESNYGGRFVLTFPLNLKWFRVLVLCPTATKDCRLIHGINPEYRKNVVGNQFSTFDSPRDFPQRISCDNVQRNREAVPLDLKPKVKTSLTSEDGQKLWRNSNAHVCAKTVDYEF